MTPWTAGEAARFLDALESAAADDLPLFRGVAGLEVGLETGEGVRVERADDRHIAATRPGLGSRDAYTDDRRRRDPADDAGAHG